jgi:cytochrome c553
VSARNVFRSGGWRWRPARLALASAAAAVAVATAGMLVVVSGVVPVGASGGHWAITAWFLHFAMQRSVATHSFGIELGDLDEPYLVLKGAGHYENGCRPCHGAPDLESPRIAAAMTPHPPPLAPAVAKFDPEELFYIVRHGVKFTGMPAWPAVHRDDEVEAVVAFLLELPGMTARSYRGLVDGDVAAGAGGSPAARGGGEVTKDAGEETASEAVVPALERLAEPSDVLDLATAACARCHGADGLGRELPAFPKLAGQSREYLRRAMDAYADGERASGIMAPIAAALDRDERARLAAYYSALAGAQATPALSAAPKLAEKIARGEKIAREGVPSASLPSCADCHGPSSHRRNPAYPVLAGQFAEYLELQLELFRKGGRGGSKYAQIMSHHVAPNLDPAWTGEVAAYYAHLREEPE